jgi:Immunity protein 40
MQYRLLLERVGQRPHPESAELALHRNDAFQAVRLLREATFPILGGDVYVRRDGHIEPAYANWHSSPQAGEERQAYLLRSWNTTETYLANYPKIDGEEPLFVIVAGEPQTPFNSKQVIAVGENK